MRPSFVKSMPCTFDTQERISKLYDTEKNLERVLFRTLALEWFAHSYDDKCDVKLTSTIELNGQQVTIGSLIERSATIKKYFHISEKTYTRNIGSSHRKGRKIYIDVKYIRITDEAVKLAELDNKKNNWIAYLK